jgi:hypothetical protein
MAKKTSTPTLISVDAGNGGTNAVLAEAKGVKTTYFPSVRAAATGDSLGLGGQFELSYLYVDWGGHRYVVGDDVVRVTRRNLERHKGAFRYGDEFHQFLVAVAIGMLGVNNGTVNLTLFAPPGLYVEAKETIIRRFMEEKGQAAIKFKGDDKPRVWHYEKVQVYPEGIGAAACFIFDNQGKIQDNTVLSGDTIILDMGVYTLDALKMQDANFNPESLETATWETGGIGVHVLEPILRVVKKQDDDFAFVTTDDIDYVLRQGLQTGNYVLKAGAKEINIQPLVDKFSERFAEWIANNIVDGVFGGLRGIKSAILVGGGTPLVARFLRKWYSDKILDPSQNELTMGIQAVDMNAIGGLRLTRHLTVSAK